MPHPERRRLRMCVASHQCGALAAVSGGGGARASQRRSWRWGRGDRRLPPLGVSASGGVGGATRRPLPLCRSWEPEQHRPSESVRPGPRRVGARFDTERVSTAAQRGMCVGFCYRCVYSQRHQRPSAGCRAPSHSTSLGGRFPALAAPRHACVPHARGSSRSRFPPPPHRPSFPPCAAGRADPTRVEWGLNPRRRHHEVL